MILMLCLYFQHLSINVSIFTLVVIALDRYRGILWPLKGGYSKFRAKIHLMIVWFLATVVALPNLISFHVSQDLVSFRPARRHMPRLATSSDYIVKTWGESGRSGFNGLGLKKKLYSGKNVFFLIALKGYGGFLVTAVSVIYFFSTFSLTTIPKSKESLGASLTKTLSKKGLGDTILW